MRINSFFTDTLGVKLRNPRWSWGAADAENNRVFLSVWRHQIESSRSGERVLVADAPHADSQSYPGYTERITQLEQIRNGAEAYGVICIRRRNHSGSSSK